MDLISSLSINWASGSNVLTVLTLCMCEIFLYSKNLLNSKQLVIVFFSVCSQFFSAMVGFSYSVYTFVVQGVRCFCLIWCEYNENCFHLFCLDRNL